MTDTMKGSVAVIDDDKAARLSVRQMLGLRGLQVEVFSSAEAALAWPGLAGVDAVVSDVRMPGMNGEQFLAEMKRICPACPLIMITGHGDIAMAVRCLRSGAYDFIEKPFEDEVLLASIGRAVERSRLTRESDDLRRRLALAGTGEDGRFGMIGRSQSMLDVYEQIEITARSNAPVLVIGETGSGKELVARAIHRQSGRAAKPFVPVNAGALPENMIESELFGHSRGAFTGADSDRDGRLVSASGGTLLLDEIECLALSAQVKLLRVLEDGEVYPLGKDKPRNVDVRIIAASKADLQAEVRAGRMREDFYHRIAVLKIAVPSLRERREDLTLLTAAFLREAVARNGVPTPEIPAEALGAMLSYTWPGNVRELKNAVERMVITASGGRTGPFEIDEHFTAGRLLSLPGARGRLSEALERTEKAEIESALREFRGEVTITAEVLGISRRALYERMKKYSLEKGDYT